MCRSSAVSVDRLAGWTLVGLAIVVGSWGRGLAYVGTVEVVPPRPTADDPVVVRVSGDLPDTCWSFVGHEVAASGGRITIRVQTSVRTGICLFVLIPYGFEAALGRLQPGPYQLTVIDAQDSKTVSFEVSGEVPVYPPYFVRGDSNGDGTVDVSDPIATLGALFLGDGELSCEDAADSNDDEEVDLSDAVHTLLYLFGGGEAPPAPGPRACGRDPDGAFPPRSPGDALGCGRHASCAPGTTGVYRLYDNGIVCVTWPCPSWTAAGEDGKEIPVTDVDMAPLGLPPEKAQEVWLELGEGRWRVRGYTVPGPEGPAGIGTTFVVLELVEPAGEAG